MANAFAVEIQQANTSAALDTTQNGVAHFNEDHFTISSGFVSLAGGGPGIDSVGVDTFTGPGTNPVLPDGAGLITVTGAQLVTGTVGANVIRSNSLAVNKYTIEIQQSGISTVADTAKNGVAHFDSDQFTVTTGFVQITNFTPCNYTQIDDTLSPYTVLSTEYFISCDSSGGVITVDLPDNPASCRQFVVKDRTGSASANNITVTTAGGAVLIDGATTQLIASNFGSLTFIFNGNTYEIY